MPSLTYQGQELELFADAHNWKRYWTSRVRPYVRGRVLEVGAGSGSNTSLLSGAQTRTYVCLEPDAGLVDVLQAKQLNGSLPPQCQIVAGTIESVFEQCFDTILYIDVIEHIADDRAELARATELLAATGHLVVLAPAYGALFSPFDRAIGHFRRYTRGTLTALASGELEPVEMSYLDSVGLLASLANRLILRERYPTPQQIRLWDRLMVPASRVLDRVVAGRLGKSVLAVWRKK